MWSDKGLQDPIPRDGIIYPILLNPLLQRPDLDKFGPIPIDSSDIDNPTSEWIRGRSKLKEGQLGFLTKSFVEWQDDLRDIILFGFICSMYVWFMRLMVVKPEATVAEPFGGNEGPEIDGKTKDEGRSAEESAEFDLVFHEWCVDDP